MPTMTAEKTEPVEPEALRQADRCDRCIGQAYVRTKHTATGFFLQFCGHHGTRFEASLTGAGFDVVEDIRHELTGDRPMSGSAIADSPECPDDDDEDDYF
jgi:hypothetical protein